GLLIGFILFCVTVLVFAAWVQTRDGAEERIANLREALAEAAPIVSDLRRDVTEAERRANHSNDQWNQARSVHERLWELLDLRNRYEGAVDRHRALLEVYNSQKYQLLYSNWRDLRGTPFEEFLSQVFSVHGFHVETTPGSGDQGLDLILNGAGRRI